MVNIALQMVPTRVDSSGQPDRADGSHTERLLARWTGFAKRRPVVSLAALAVTTQAAGLIGVPFTARAVGGWYDQLDKPFFNPPSAVFAPVWTTLYAAMAGSAWLVSRAEASDRQRRALKLFAGQLALNAAWTPLFFGAKAPTVALVEITALLAAVVATTAASFAVRPSAGGLLVPYAAWVAFATALNAAIVVLNR